jgi:hypothetical protein
VVPWKEKEKVVPNENRKEKKHGHEMGIVKK